MTIYDSPTYHGHLYIDFDNKDGAIAFDCCYKNTKRLVDMLVSMLGILTKKPTDELHLAKYYNAIKHCLSEHKDCTISDSFVVDGCVPKFGHSMKYFSIDWINCYIE